MPRGTITSFDPLSGTGIITAEDGSTYPFDISDVSPDSRARTNGTGSRPHLDTGNGDTAERRISRTDHNHHNDHNDKD